MDSKLERFFNAINFNNEYYSYFNDASVKEVLLNKKTNKMTLVINIDKTLPINIFSELNNQSKTFDGAKSVRFKFITKESLYFNDYFNYYFDILVSRCPMLICIDRDKILIEGNSITFNVLNDVEENKIKSLEEKMILFLSSMGFSDVSINTIVNEEERELFKKKIKTEEVKEVKKENKLIKGRNIIGENSFIKNLIANENNVIIIGKVFGIESKSTQSGWHILNLKITDHSDSMLANIFTKDKDELNHLESSIKSGKWYKFRGNVKFDTRSNDYVYGINDVEEFDKNEIKLVDDAEVKRVELHAHTMMSQMDGITKVDLSKHKNELVEKCIDM